MGRGGDGREENEGKYLNRDILRSSICKVCSILSLSGLFRPKIATKKGKKNKLQLIHSTYSVDIIRYITYCNYVKIKKKRRD